MAESIQVLRLVVASPGDVSAERNAVAAVVGEINQALGVDRGLRIDAIRWETDTYPGFHPDGPQGLIDPILRIQDCDILVGIFWKRFGTPTIDAASGSAHEFQLAYQAWKGTGRPQVMMYFSQKSHTPQSKEETDQWGQVLEFRRQYPKEGLWWPYNGPSQFAALFRVHLTNYIRDAFPMRSAPAMLVPEAIPGAPHRDYFAVQSRIIEEHTRTFVGRSRPQKAFQDFLQSQKRGYFIVRGGPGQGKTALSAHLIREAGYIHHFVSRTGGRSDPRLILRSLVSQFPASAWPRDGRPESVSDLTKAFEELLFQSASRQKKTVILIDALDELPGDTEDPPYLITGALPDNVFLLVTSRPGDRLNRFQERRSNVPQQVYELEPLELSEMREILQSHKPDISPAEVERIADTSQGNPLYLSAVTDMLRTNPRFDLQTLPPSIEGFFRSATSDLGDAEILGDILRILSVARALLSLRDLSRIAGKPQREVFDRGIRPIRSFLLELNGGYTFYHARFHEFVTRTMFYEDELQVPHRKITAWLQLPECRKSEYRLSSLAYHLFASGDCSALTQAIDEPFLAEKVQRLGYAVLEDIELWTRALLELEDPALVTRCVSLVESLRHFVGGDIIRDVAKAVQPYQAGPASFRSHLMETSLRSIPGLDVYSGILPKGEVTADFVETIPSNGSLVLAIGDAPAVGLKSAFVARFLGNMFHKLVERGAHSVQLDQVLVKLKQTVRNEDYFSHVSMQCAALDPTAGILRLANAGHPYPVHYSARRGKCDILPLRGGLLRDLLEEPNDPVRYEEYRIKIGIGDVIVFLTDGLTEDHVMAGEPYGYRFREIMMDRAKDGARAIGEAILDDWTTHPREEDAGDDVSIIVVTLV